MAQEGGVFSISSVLGEYLDLLLDNMHMIVKVLEWEDGLHGCFGESNWTDFSAVCD